MIRQPPRPPRYAEFVVFKTSPSLSAREVGQYLWYAPSGLLVGARLIHLSSSNWWCPLNGVTAVWVEVCQPDLRSVGLWKSWWSFSSSDRQSSVSSAVSWMMSSHDISRKWYHPTCLDYKTVFVLCVVTLETAVHEAISPKTQHTFSCSRAFDHITQFSLTDKVCLLVVEQFLFYHINEKTSLCQQMLLKDPNQNVNCVVLALSSHEHLSENQRENWMFAVWERKGGKRFNRRKHRKTESEARACSKHTSDLDN